MKPMPMHEKEHAGTTLDAYMEMNYPIDLFKDGDEYTALHPDLPGCMSYGETPNEAVASLERIKRLWISGRLDSGMDVPKPELQDEFSGKFLLRVPKSLHRELHLEALRNGVSLNHYVTHILSSRNQIETLMSEYRVLLERALTALTGAVTFKQLYSSHPNAKWRLIGQPQLDLISLIPHAPTSFSYSASKGDRVKYLEASHV